MNKVIGLFYRYPNLTESELARSPARVRHVS
jgi:hypothetical protein